MTETLPILKESLRNSTIIQKGEYNYFINPITDGIPELSLELLIEVKNYISDIIDNGIQRINKIITIEAMGIPVATAVSLATNIPLTIIRKRQYNLPGEIIIDQETGYSNNKLYLNGINSGDHVVIIDDVISTGNTIVGIISALNEVGAIIDDIVIIVEKGFGASYLRAQGHDIQTLVKINVNKNSVIIED